MQNKSKEKRSFFSRVIYFFPLQLLFVHLKKNHQLLLFWLFLFLIIYQQVGVKYGVPLLFLAPEYLGSLSFSSYFILGFAIGGFVMAFNIASYIMNGFRFPFLATLSKPFLKYCINNSLLPLLFIIAYLFRAYGFLNENESFTQTDILYRLLGFLGGYFIFVFFSLFYFMATNKDLEKLFGKEIAKVVSSDTKKGEPAKILLDRSHKDWYKLHESDRKSWRVDSYLGIGFRLKQTRPYAHYDQKMLSQVFRQNHINASVFEIFIITSIIILGLFRENEVFIIPAAATVCLLITMLLMITSAMRSWLRGWTWVVILLFLIGLNQLSKYDDFYYESRLPGIDYEYKSNYLAEKTKSDFSKQLKSDLEANEKMLSAWKQKNHSTANKPKAIFVATSGGGSRAAFWSFLALQHLDSLTKGQLFDHTILYSGSSGGTIGSAYFRELRWQQQQEKLDAYDSKYRLDLSKDMLNPVIFTLAVNDILIRTQKFNYKGEKYWKDRGYIFEKTLNQHSRVFLDHPLHYYQKAEQSAEIPLLLMTPAIVNDSRRLLVSTMPMSFMTSLNGGKSILKENIEYLRLFEENDPLQARFLTLLRMNASFPYIMPTINLPTQPTIEAFDSGLRDNYGIKTTVKYIYHLREWLAKNTSGVIILQIRDGLKAARKKEAKGKRSIADELLSPFGSLYGNWFQVQDFNNDELIEYAKEWYPGDLEVINYQLDKSPQKNISLSWHLTSKEKQQILSSLQLEANKAAEKRLLQSLN